MLASRITSRTFADICSVVAVPRPRGMRPSMILCLMGAIATMSHVDAATQWSSTGSMITDRASHAATMLADGRVLAAGVAARGKK
jgi:hypothetical protein